MTRVRAMMVLLICCLAWAAAAPAFAQTKREPESEIDPSLFRIDEAKYLGTKVDASLALTDDQGRPFVLGDKMGLPLIMVLSYYQCDGTCSVVNADLKRLLGEVDRVAMGKDYRVVTVSFDPKDTTDTLAAFHKGLDVPSAWDAGWTFALAADAAGLRRMTDSIGFKYFWSPRDRTFFHPGVFVVMSPEGRVVRYLYSLSTEAKDVELALIDALQGKVAAPSQLINYAVSLCYSYNYAEGRYTVNIPMFVGMGSLAFGVIVLVVSVVAYRRRRRKESTV